MSDISTKKKIALMTQGGKALASILGALMVKAQPGVRLLQLDQTAQQMIAKKGGTPSFMTVAGYEWATCLCVNDVVVHGVPSAYALQEGDVLTIDIGMVYGGFHTDSAWTKVVHSAQYKVQSKIDAFLNVGEKALAHAISQARVGNRIGHISGAIQETVEAAGYHVVRSLVGHGVGRELHEAPQIPGFVRGKIERTEEIVPGMTLAIEAIYTMGNGHVIYDHEDGWSISTADKSLSAVFEHTIAVGSDGKPVVLTRFAK